MTAFSLRRLLRPPLFPLRSSLGVLAAFTGRYATWFRDRLAACAGAAALAGCASLSAPPAEPMSGAGAAGSRPYYETISLTGRLSVRYQQNGRDEALHGGFTWQQQPERLAITLLSPTGQTMAVIDVTPSVATLFQSGQPPRQASDVDQLTAQTLGWPLPIAGLQQWLQGFGVGQGGAPFVATPALDKALITKDGWQLRYDAWQPLVEAPGGFRPRRIDLERLTEQAGPVALRIVIDQWQTTAQ